MTSTHRAQILVVDDHVEMARLLADRLTDAGHSVEVTLTGQEALAKARRSLPDLVITDLRMEKVDGFDVLSGIRALDPDVPVIIMTAFGAIDSAVEAIKLGAYHYLTKPFALEEAQVFVERALEEHRLRVENRALRRVAVERSGFASMVGRSKPMLALFDLVERVAQSHAPVLIRGESGTGKELVARALHFEGLRRNGPFVATNCTALPETLLESELFGHVKGAFTGATAARRGLFVEADGGTLFLDEIGDMTHGLQAKLLRTLEDGEIRAVGSDGMRRVDVRVIAATHHDLEEGVRQGGFRPDLFFRLNVVPLAVPALRERPEDIPILAEHFLTRARERNPTSPVERLSPALVSALARCPWPGNVRELQNVIERLVIVANKPTLEVADLEARAPGVLADACPIDRARVQLLPLKQLEAEYIAWVVDRCGGNKTRAAELLGIDVSTIHRRERTSS
ncbi:MAG: sigma-54-dependent Fis family transcriptional regulator [Deltaproteobacteria bacterium]|nr:sigma-54-dependent Fis family transcriptional regulator [Deltaproteobacteria bacterium]